MNIKLSCVLLLSVTATALHSGDEPKRTPPMEIKKKQTTLEPRKKARGTTPLSISPNECGFVHISTSPFSETPNPFLTVYAFANFLGQERNSPTESSL